MTEGHRTRKGKNYGSERVLYTDAETGARIVQLTSFPTIGMNLYFEQCSFTADSQRLIFYSQRAADRDAPFDVFRADVDGTNLVRLTDRDDVGGLVLAPKAAKAFFSAGSEVRSVDLETFKEETLAHFEGFHSFASSLGGISSDEGNYYAYLHREEERYALVRVATDGKGGEVLYEGFNLTHVNVDPKTGTVAFGERAPDETKNWLMNPDGSNLRRFTFEKFAHCSWWGQTGAWQGCYLPPDRGICIYREGGEKEEVIVSGSRYFWHSGSSPDGEWIVADTNWPDEGIFLVHVPSKRSGLVCRSRSSNGHPQWTHPHPSISPDGNYVLFNSDRPGISQVHLATIPEGLKERLVKGDVTVRDRTLCV